MINFVPRKYMFLMWRMFVKYDIRYGIISNLTRKLVLMTSFIIILLIFIWNNGSFGIYSYSHHQFNGWFDPYFTSAGLFDLWVNWFREDLRVLLNLLKQGKIKPIIAARMPLNEAPKAHELLEKGSVMCKIVFICNL